MDIVERLRFDATRCELEFSKGVAGNIDDAASEIERLRAALEDARRDIFSMAPKQGSRSPLRKVAEAATARIEKVLTQQLTKETKP